MATKPKLRPKRKPKHAGGRPSQGLTEAALLVTGPASLLDAVTTAAEVEGVSVREYARRALRERTTRRTK